jgi:hypothetical protein
MSQVNELSPHGDGQLANTLTYDKGITHCDYLMLCQVNCQPGKTKFKEVLVSL